MFGLKSLRSVSSELENRIEEDFESVQSGAMYVNFCRPVNANRKNFNSNLRSCDLPATDDLRGSEDDPSTVKTTEMSLCHHASMY
jgi:hypothetical protein